MRYNIDIAALSETRFSDSGELTERGQGYTFFWKGKPAGERREAGVGFAIKSSLVAKLQSVPVGTNDRLMTMRLPLQKKTYVTLISAYAPTMSYSEEQKEAFYEELANTVKSAPSSDRLILLGDFNARVGLNHKQWEGVLGRHGVGTENSNGQLLLSFCAQHKLTITNTLFQLPDRHKTTWMHPRSKHWHMIDYVICRQKDVKDVLITRAMKGAECWTDHSLLRCKLSLKVACAPRRQATHTKKKLNVCQLCVPSIKRDFQDKLAERIQPPVDCTDNESRWATFSNNVYTAAKEIVGHPT